MSYRSITSRAIPIALFVSLALNLFLAGFIIARMFVPHWSFEPKPPMGPDAIVERLSSKLDSADAATLRAGFDADKAELRRRFGEMQSARRELRAKLMAEPFDRNALAQAMVDLRARHDAFYAEIQDALLKSVDKLSPEGRGKLLSGPAK